MCGGTQPGPPNFTLSHMDVQWGFLIHHCNPAGDAVSRLHSAMGLGLGTDH